MQKAADPVYFVLALAWSVVFTLVLLFVRTRVRVNRQRTIDELGLLFFADQKVAVAAFDYVRAKYEMITKAEKVHGTRLRRPVAFWGLLGSAIPYMTLCAVGFVILLVPKSQLLRDDLGFAMVYDNIFWTMMPGPGDERLLEAAAVYGAAFLGGYLMTGRVLLRAVQNYELTQLGFLQAAAHLAFGLVSAMVLFHVLRQTGAGTVFGAGAVFDAFAGLLVLAFLGGYLPDLGIINLSRRLRVKFLKTVDDDSLNAASIMPLEMLDGIDYDIRYRLDQAGLYDVQNLAVANPLLIYIETPFTLYAAFDWVLQAQLCVAVGGPTFRDLRQHKVRTSLDLERAVLGDDATDEFILSIGRILFPARPPHQGDSSASGFSADSVRHGVMVMLDDLHVHRMRSLWEHVFQQITGGSNRLWIYRSQPGLIAAVLGGVASPTRSAG